MKPEYIAHVHELTTTLTLLRPVLVSIGVLNFPTVDELLEMARSRSDNEEAQIEFINGYLKGAGLVCGNIGNINRVAEKSRAVSHVKTNRRGFFSRLFG